MNNSTTPKRNFFTGAAVAISMLFAQSALAKEGDVQIGMLECDVKGGVGLILGSKKKMTCTFTKSDGSVENYTGRVTKVGLDIGVTKKSKIVWAVLAPSKTADKGALAGKYHGVGAEVTVVGGLGANILISVGNAFTLQPFSIQGQEGLNIAGGLEEIKLKYVK
ncbi:MAG: DUF992 domain-containing protein [Rhodobacteraceae bacterium]|nr:DUF992 domain-containing protein [Paracoccaceae bacterium]